MNNVKIGMGYDKNGHFLTATESEIIENALIQEKEGIKPHFAWYDYKKKEVVTPVGWLVWSLRDGCGIVYRRHDGKMIICKGRQGDFCYI